MARKLKVTGDSSPLQLGGSVQVTLNEENPAFWSELNRQRDAALTLTPELNQWFGKEFGKEFPDGSKS